MHDVLNVSCPATVVVAELPVPLEAGMPGAVAFDVDVVRRIAPAQIEYPDHHGGRPYARAPTASCSHAGEGRGLRRGGGRPQTVASRAPAQLSARQLRSRLRRRCFISTPPAETSAPAPWPGRSWPADGAPRAVFAGAHPARQIRRCGDTAPYRRGSQAGSANDLDVYVEVIGPVLPDAISGVGGARQAASKGQAHAICEAQARTVPVEGGREAASRRLKGVTVMPKSSRVASTRSAGI